MSSNSRQQYLSQQYPPPRLFCTPSRYRGYLRACQRSSFLVLSEVSEVVFLPALRTFLYLDPLGGSNVCASYIHTEIHIETFEQSSVVRPGPFRGTALDVLCSYIHVYMYIYLYLYLSLYIYTYI